MPYSISLTINHIPKTLNEALRSHWTTYKKDSEKIGKEISLQLIGKMPERPIKKTHIWIRRYSSGTLDRDNKFFTAKHILDNLVKLGVVENDTEENIVELQVSQEKIKRGEPRKIVVLIEQFTGW